MNKRATYRTSADSEFIVPPKGMREHVRFASGHNIESVEKPADNRFVYPNVNARMLPESDWDPVSATPAAAGDLPGSGTIRKLPQPTAQA